MPLLVTFDTFPFILLSETDYIFIGSALVRGVVCTKNVKHKRMVSQHKNPRIFILRGALEYQKATNRLASINTVLQQVIS